MDVSVLLSRRRTRVFLTKVCCWCLEVFGGLCFVVVFCGGGVFFLFIPWDKDGVFLHYWDRIKG